MIFKASLSWYMQNTDEAGKSDEENILWSCDTEQAVTDIYTIRLL